MWMNALGWQVIHNSFCSGPNLAFSVWDFIQLFWSGPSHPCHSEPGQNWMTYLIPSCSFDRVSAAGTRIRCKAERERQDRGYVMRWEKGVTQGRGKYSRLLHILHFGTCLNQYFRSDILTGVLNPISKRSRVTHKKQNTQKERPTGLSPGNLPQFNSSILVPKVSFFKASRKETVGRIAHYHTPAHTVLFVIQVLFPTY